MADTQTYNSGALSVYRVENAAEGGKMPKDKLTVKLPLLRYEERTVGMARYWAGMQNTAQITRMLRVPKHTGVSPQDVVITDDGKQYKIEQIQYIEDVTPKSMDLSLERVTKNYDVG